MTTQFVTAVAILTAPFLGLSEPPDQNGQAWASASILLVNNQARKAEDISIKRNQKIQAVFSRGSLKIISQAKAIEQGRVGDVIRFYNLNSKRIGIGRVIDGGTVQVE